MTLSTRVVALVASFPYHGAYRLNESMNHYRQLFKTIEQVPGGHFLRCYIVDLS